MKKKIFDPSRTGPQDLKFGTSEHNTVSTDNPCCSTTQIDSFMMVTANQRHQFPEILDQYQKIKDTFRPWLQNM